MKLLQKLQSRIDTRANLICKLEGDSKPFIERLNMLRQEQTLDKRIYGELVYKNRRVRQFGKKICTLGQFIQENAL